MKQYWQSGVDMVNQLFYEHKIRNTTPIVILSAIELIRVSIANK